MSCPKCGTTTPQSQAGHRSLCLPCTESELGETYVEIRNRVTAARSVKKKWKR